MTRTFLPPDFPGGAGPGSAWRDRPHRWFWNIMVALRIRPVKAVCCQSFRNPAKMRACKGCATLYDKNSSSWLYRTIARLARRRAPAVSSKP